MNGGSNGEREGRASDALLVSALRLGQKDGEKVDPECLPEFTDEEKAAMNALGTDLVKRLLAGELMPRQPKPEDDHWEGEQEQSELAMAGGELDRGLNRAEELDDITTEERERKKREILERKARERKGGTGGD